VKDIIIAKAAGKASAENIKNKITRNFWDYRLAH
jgi:hypothetical protein